MEALKRFGWALIASALIVSGFGTAVYVRHPATSLEPKLVKASAVGGSAKAIADENAVAVVADFFDALERNDDARLQRDFPGMTAREKRILQGIHRRLGRDSHFTVAVRDATRHNGVIDLELIVFATVPGSDRQRRLPFTATTKLDNGEWKIIALR